jgi:glucosamine--fructose-6-phosphate aminotransferase (isomerizing)
MEIEARETPAVAARIARDATRPLADLGERLRKLAPRYALAAGRGSSDAAALLAKYLFEMHLGLPTVSVAPSIRSIYGAQLKLEKALLLTISQSGRSPDLVEFVRSATGPDVLRAGFVNAHSSPLGDALDVCIPIDAGLETSVAATKSCLGAMALVLGLTAHWSGNAAAVASLARLPDRLTDALQRDWPTAETFLADDGPVYVIGRGPGLAIAAEAALKLKETNGLHAEAVSGAELRHGPLALAGPGLRVLVFAQRDAAFDGLHKTATDLEQRGCRVLFISPQSSAASVATDDEPMLELLAMLQRFYLLANAAALNRGLSPDSPPSLTKVTETR